MFAKLRSEATAAVLLAVGMLAAAGYLITWSRLANQRLPTGEILAALPKGFFVGVATQSLLLPSLVVMLVGGLLLDRLGRRRSGAGGLMSGGRGDWAVAGFGMATSAWLVVNFPYRAIELSALYVGWVIVGVAGAVLLATVAGRFATRRVSAMTDGTTLDSVGAFALLLIVLSIATAAGFSVIDARFVSRPLAEAVVYINWEDCPGVPAERREPPGCPIAGVYVGENSDWVYLVDKTGVVFPGEIGRRLPGRVFFVARDRIRQIRLAKDLSP